MCLNIPMYTSCSSTTSLSGLLCLSIAFFLDKFVSKIFKRVDFKTKCLISSGLLLRTDNKTIDPQLFLLCSFISTDVHRF